MAKRVNMQVVDQKVSPSLLYGSQKTHNWKVIWNLVEETRQKEQPSLASLIAIDKIKLTCLLIFLSIALIVQIYVQTLIAIICCNV